MNNYDISQTGHKAKSAYDSYVKDKLIELREELFDQFKQTEINDKDTLVDIRHLLEAVDQLESKVLIDIQNGNIAKQAIAEEEK